MPCWQRSLANGQIPFDIGHRYGQYRRNRLDVHRLMSVNLIDRECNRLMSQKSRQKTPYAMDIQPVSTVLGTVIWIVRNDLNFTDLRLNMKFIVFPAGNFQIIYLFNRQNLLILALKSMLWWIKKARRSWRRRRRRGRRRRRRRRRGRRRRRRRRRRKRMVFLLSSVFQDVHHPLR